MVAPGQLGGLIVAALQELCETSHIGRARTHHHFRFQLSSFTLQEARF